MTEPTSWWDRPYQAAEDETWRDMTNGELFKERAVKTTMVVLALLVAIGVAVAIYYCCTTTSTYLEHGWRAVEESNRLLSIIPGVLGTVIVLAFLIPPFCCINYERGSHTCKSDETIADQEERRHNLLLKDLKYVYENYGSGQTSWRRSNLSDLTEGVLTNAQKRELHQLDSEYHQKAKVIAEYSDKSESLMKDIKANSEHRYSRAVKSLETLEQRWKTLKGNIPAESKAQSPLSTN